MTSFIQLASSIENFVVKLKFLKDAIDKTSIYQLNL